LPTKTYYIQRLAAAYPNLNIIFESDNVTLYDVNIYNGDGRIQWKRRTLPNGTITEDFLKYGPNGSFSSSDVQKSATAEKEYVFQNEWIVKDDAGTVLGTIGNAEPLWNTEIKSNIHLYPHFEEEIRSYEVTVKMKHPVTGEIQILKETAPYKYGTKFNEIVPSGYPIYIDNSSLDLTQSYDLKGFALVEDSETLIPS
jgi:hypothetical protein